MGKKVQKKNIFLIVLLLLTSCFVYWRTEPVKAAKPIGLQTLLGPVPGYQITGTLALDPTTVSYLELDDYTQGGYKKDGSAINLYIGYYFTSDKVSAAHSPLVCFPGQGWTLTDPDTRQLQVGRHLINYAEMTATLEHHKELVLFWYQAHDKTETEIYRNKFHTLLNQITAGRQEHAFVRVSVPVGEAGLEEARLAGRAFISAFYPIFLSYVDSSQQRVR